MMSEKYLSIITNFGCHFKCPYCVTKKSGITVPKTTIEGLDNLTTVVRQTGTTIVSISGGGDPMYDYRDNVDWWDKLFEWSWDTGIPLELHTSYINSKLPYGQFERVVYHCRQPSDMYYIKRDMIETIRVVFVVTQDYTPELINDIWTIKKHHPCIEELSFRQMVDEHYIPTDYCSDYLRQWHKDRWWYIEQDDYNTYYVNGKIYHRFADIGKEEEKV